MRRHSRQGQPPSPQRQSRKRHRALCSVAMTLSVVTLGACSSSADTVAARHDAVQHSLDALVSEDGLPAALASIQDRNGNSHNYTAGVGDLTTGSEVPPNGQIRIGSNTKTFTAVVVLQLVAEGKIELDTPIETYLPGLVRGDGIDGHNITIRQLLQHTSGLPNYSNYLEDEVRYYDPRELLDIALEHPADFAPGTSWKYSNTNYVLAAYSYRRSLKKPLAEEMNRRIFAPIDLQHTYFPEPYDEKISELHPRGYYRESIGRASRRHHRDRPLVGMGRRAIDLHHLGPQPVSPRTPRRTTAPRSPTRPDAHNRPRGGNLRTRCPLRTWIGQPSATVWRPVLEPRRQFPWIRDTRGALPTTDAKRTSRSACK